MRVAAGDDEEDIVTTTDDDRIARLERRLAEQQGELERLRAHVGAPAPDGPDAADSGPPPEPRSSRRTMLRGGAVAAGAAIVGALARPDTAAAADGGNMVIGANNVSAAGNTRLRTPSPGSDLDNRNILTVSDDATSSAFPAAIGAIAQGARIHNGVYTFASSRVNSDGATGHALVVRALSGARSAIYVVPSGGNPTTTDYPHRRGEIRVDASSDLWLCVSSGTPGTWRKISGISTAGAIHALDPPRRAYDSRFVDGPLGTGDERVVSVASGIDVDTGVVNLANMVPSGSTAVFFNLAITQTTGFGFLQVAPGSATEVTAATINWESAGVTVSNASLSSIDDSRRVNVLSGGDGSAHFIIDITGYTL